MTNQLAEEELNKVNGGTVLDELPSGISDSHTIYVRLIKIADNDGNPIIPELVSNWYRYSERLISEITKGLSAGQYRLEYVVI